MSGPLNALLVIFLSLLAMSGFPVQAALTSALHTHPLTPQLMLMIPLVGNQHLNGTAWLHV